MTSSSPLTKVKLGYTKTINVSKEDVEIQMRSEE